MSTAHAPAIDHPAPAIPVAHAAHMAARLVIAISVAKAVAMPMARTPAAVAAAKAAPVRTAPAIMVPARLMSITIVIKACADAE